MLTKKHAGLPNVRQIRKVLALVVGFGSLVVSSNAQDQSALGSWTDPASMPTHAVHAVSLPTGKVLFFNRKGQTYLFDPITNMSSPAALPPFDIFCTGHVSLGDGTIFFAGGHINNNYGLPAATIYNPFTNSWRTLPKMAFARWYPTCTLMPNGKDVFVESGVITPELGTARTPEYWDSAKGLFRSLNGITLTPPIYPMQYLTRQGRIISPGPLLNTREFDVTGQGSEKVVATRAKDIRDYGSSVQFARGKILIGGGGDPTKTCEILDITTGTPKWSAAEPMASARRQCQFTLLPNGDVLAVGGSSGPGFTNPAFPVFTPEIWNPVTGKWKSMAPSTQNGNRFCFRGYHQNAVLLPNGRVWSTAGDDSSDPSKSYPSFQLFSPPYLYASTKPTISANPSYALLGSFVPLSIASNVEVTGINLVRLAAVTHSNDMSQVIAPLSFRVTDGAYTAQLPSDPTHTPPGWYYMFAVDANGGVSDAKYIQIGTTTLAPTDARVRSDSSGRVLSWTNPNPNSDTTLLTTSVDGRTYTRAKSIVGRTSETFTDPKVVYVKLQASGPAGLSDKTIPIRVADAATTLTSKDFRGVVEGLTSMLCTLVDSSGFPVANAKVNFRLPNGRTGTAVTASDGVAEFAFEVQPNWNNSIVEAEFAGDGPFGPSKTSAKLIVSKRNTRMYVGARTGMIGQTMNLAFSMDWIPESFLITRSGLKIRVAIDGVPIGTAVTDETGFASLAYKLNPQPGNRTITAYFDGDANYFKCSGSAPLVVNRASTITWAGVRDLYRGGTVNVPASLKDSATNQFIPNASLKVYVDDVLSQTVVTDTSGAATIPLFAAENAPDSLVLKVVFEGDATRAPSQISRKLNIVNPPSQVWVGNRTVKRGETATVPTTLKNTATGKYIAGATLRVQIGGVDAGTVVTGETGTASVKVPTSATSPSSIDVTLFFDGDKLIQASKGTGTVTVQ